jgi:hypothetical protein
MACLAAAKVKMCYFGARRNTEYAGSIGAQRVRSLVGIY